MIFGNAKGRSTRNVTRNGDILEPYGDIKKKAGLLLSDSNLPRLVVIDQKLSSTSQLWALNGLRIAV